MALAHYEEGSPVGGAPSDLGEMEEPEPWLPKTDAQTAQLVEDAVGSLAVARSRTTAAEDPSLRLLCLVSLMAQAEACAYDYVAQAYEAGYSWDDISWATGDLLGDLQATYGPYVQWRAAEKHKEAKAG
jgi:hypothetical protein